VLFEHILLELTLNLRFQVLLTISHYKLPEKEMVLLKEMDLLLGLKLED
jgi:hypothetical protein